MAAGPVTAAKSLLLGAEARCRNTRVDRDMRARTGAFVSACRGQGELITDARETLRIMPLIDEIDRHAVLQSGLPASLEPFLMQRR